MVLARLGRQEHARTEQFIGGEPDEPVRAVRRRVRSLRPEVEADDLVVRVQQDDVCGRAVPRWWSRRRCTATILVMVDPTGRMTARILRLRRAHDVDVVAVTEPLATGLRSARVPGRRRARLALSAVVALITA